jgi:hypothetical protein
MPTGNLVVKVFPVAFAVQHDLKPILGEQTQPLRRCERGAIVQGQKPKVQRFAMTHPVYKGRFVEGPANLHGSYGRADAGPTRLFTCTALGNSFQEKVELCEIQQNAWKPGEFSWCRHSMERVFSLLSRGKTRPWRMRPVREFAQGG